MWRETLTPRADWQAKVESLGLVWHSADGDPYWNEAACYHFSHEQVAAIAQATRAVSDLLLAAGDHIIERGLFPRFGIPDWCVPLIVDAWEAEPPALNYGRFDLGFDGQEAPRLFEFNCDTPTSLLEAAVVQWHWLEDTRAGADQFNLIHEALVRRWKDILPAHARVHFAGCLDEVEDRVTVEYLRETCAQAGFATELLDISGIGWKDDRFVDLADAGIATLFKLYPWEWLVVEPFAVHLPHAATRWIEPAWKQVLSNKSLLPLLWERHRGHPNLLPASHDPRDIDGATVAKPRFGREGEGVHVSDRGMHFAEPGMVYQAHAPLYRSDAGHALLGLWIVGDDAVGLGMREDASPITGNASRFIPHCFD